MKRGIWLLLLVSCSSGPEPDVKSPYAYGRYLGALQLSEKSGSNSVREILGLLEDPDYLARSGAVVALGRMRDPGFAQHLIPYLSLEKEPSGLVRSDVCLSLKRLGNPDAVEPLLDTLRLDEDPVVRREAARAVADFGVDSRIILGLVRALLDPDASVSWLAEVSLDLQENPSGKMIEIILEGWKSGDEKVRAGVARAVALTGRGALAEKLIPVVDPSPLVRIHSCRAIALLKSPGTSHVLLKVLKEDKDTGVRAAAARNLSRFGKSPPVLEGLVSALDDPGSLVRAKAHQALITVTGAENVERSRDAWTRYLKEHP